LLLFLGKIVFEGQDGEEDTELEIVEKKLDEFEQTTNNTVYPPYLAYSPSSDEEVSPVYILHHLMNKLVRFNLWIV